MPKINLVLHEPQLDKLRAIQYATGATLSFSTRRAIDDYQLVARAKLKAGPKLKKKG